jgi:Dirigent-like protein
MHNIPKRTAGLALAALALAGTVVVASGATAQDPTPRTLTFKTLEKGSTFKHVRNTKPKSERANPIGDVIVFTNPVADGAGRAVGTLYANCTTTKGARDFRRSTTTCTGVVALRDGTLTVQGNNRPGVATTTGAVTGGTGSYANARGVFVANDVSGDLTVTLAD